MVWNNLLHLDVGVDLFVILSGIGLGFGAHYAGAASFLARRFIRILPAYWLILTLCLICNTHFLGEHYSSANLWIHYLGIQGAVGGNYIFAINDSFWFITLIVGLYVLYCPQPCPAGSRPNRLLLARRGQLRPHRVPAAILPGSTKASSASLRPACPASSSASCWVGTPARPAG